MRGIFVVVLTSFVGLIHGQGSGDDYIVITPTSLTAISKAAPPTDATNDSGSGDDDEDYSTGSGASTTATSTLKPTTYTDDDDDDGSGSGSGSFVTPSLLPKPEERPTSNTDIYISESSTPKASTTDVATTASKTAAMTTVNVPDAVTTTSAGTKNKNVVEVTTESPTRPTEEETATTTSVDSTTKAQRETTKAQRETTTAMKENTDVETTTSAERPSMAHTKSTMDPDVSARHGDIQDKGFTLTTEVIAGVVGCALLALLLIAFLMYRLKKRDEGSYLLDDPYDKKMGNSDKEAFV